MCHNEASTEEKHIPYRTYSHYFAYKFVHLWNSNYFSAQIKASITFFSVHVTNSYEGGNLAASKIRNLECPSYEICLIDYGCGKFNRKIHIMEQYP